MKDRQRESVAGADETREVSRRDFLTRGIGAGIAFLAALVGIPVVGAAIGPAFRPPEATWVELGSLDNFSLDVPSSVQFPIKRLDGWVETTELKSAWVVRTARGVTVFNGRCTHLGCAYHWEASSSRFECPCHAGVFAADGAVVSGPPPRSLDPLPVRVEGNILNVQYLDFRLGVEERVAA